MSSPRTLRSPRNYNYNVDESTDALPIAILQVGENSHVISTGKSISIGRANNCDIKIDDPLISLNHAKIVANSYDEIFIRATQNSNHTRLQQIPLRPNLNYPLHHNTTIYFANVKATFIKVSSVEDSFTLRKEAKSPPNISDDTSQFQTLPMSQPTYDEQTEPLFEYPFSNLSFRKEENLNFNWFYNLTQSDLNSSGSKSLVNQVPQTSQVDKSSESINLQLCDVTFHEETTLNSKPFSMLQSNMEKSPLKNKVPKTVHSETLEAVTQVHKPPQSYNIFEVPTQFHSEKFTKNNEKSSNHQNNAVYELETQASNTQNKAKTVYELETQASNTQNKAKTVDELGTQASNIQNKAKTVYELGTQTSNNQNNSDVYHSGNQIISPRRPVVVENAEDLIESNWKGDEFIRSTQSPGEQDRDDEKTKSYDGEIELENSSIHCPPLFPQNGRSTDGVMKDISNIYSRKSDYNLNVPSQTKSTENKFPTYEPQLSGDETVSGSNVIEYSSTRSPASVHGGESSSSVIILCDDDNYEANEMKESPSLIPEPAKYRRTDWDCNSTQVLTLTPPLGACYVEPADWMVINDAQDNVESNLHNTSTPKFGIESKTDGTVSDIVDIERQSTPIMVVSPSVDAVSESPELIAHELSDHDETDDVMRLGRPARRSLIKSPSSNGDENSTDDDVWQLQPPHKRRKLQIKSPVQRVFFEKTPTSRQKKIVEKLGGSVTHLVDRATIFISDCIRRSINFLSAIALSLPIVSPQWLEQSHAENQFVDSEKYSVRDDKAEGSLGLNLVQSVRKASKKKLLLGYTVYASPSIQPPPNNILALAERSGANILKVEPRQWPTKTLYISCEEDASQWPSKLERHVRIFETEFLIIGVLRQELDFRTFLLR